MTSAHRLIVPAVLLAALTVAAGGPAIAQSGSAAGTPPPPATREKPLVITGCVTTDRSSETGGYTLRDQKAGISYRLLGLKVFAYEGRKVRIVGGLYPNANVAAQAGAIDPTRAAMAAAPGGLGAVGQPVEFHVTEVRPVRGACPPAK